MLAPYVIHLDQNHGNRTRPTKIKDAVRNFYWHEKQKKYVKKTLKTSKLEKSVIIYTWIMIMVLNRKMLHFKVIPYSYPVTLTVT